MSKRAELHFRVSLDFVVTVQDCDADRWNATDEELAANQRLLEAVLRDPSLIQLAVRDRLTSELTEAFGWDMVAANPIFVDYKEKEQRFVELIKAQFSAEDQDILLSAFDDESLSDQSMPFYSAITVTQEHFQFQPIVESMPNGQ